MKKEIFKKYLPYVVAIVVFVLLAVIYAAPEAFDGKVIQAGEKVSAIGMGNEVMHYYKSTGEMAEHHRCHCNRLFIVFLHYH